VAGLWKDYGFSRIDHCSSASASSSSSIQNGGENYSCAMAALKVKFPEVVQLAEQL